MAFGRLIRVGTHHGDANAIIYAVAEADSAQALHIFKSKLAQFDGEVEDLGRVSNNLLRALRLARGEMMKT